MSLLANELNLSLAQVHIWSQAHFDKFEVILKLEKMWGRLPFEEEEEKLIWSSQTSRTADKDATYVKLNYIIDAWATLTQQGT